MRNGQVAWFTPVRDRSANDKNRGIFRRQLATVKISETPGTSNHVKVFCWVFADLYRNSVAALCIYIIA